jgi:hypothetical protein
MWGYNHMIRFWVKLFFEHPAQEVQALEYYLRLDTDSLVDSQIRYDIFERMRAREYVYGFHDTVRIFTAKCW